MAVSNASAASNAAEQDMERLEESVDDLLARIEALPDHVLLPYRCPSVLLPLLCFIMP
jgi:hypothetical protein